MELHSDQLSNCMRFNTSFHRFVGRNLPVCGVLLSAGLCAAPLDDPPKAPSVRLPLSEVILYSSGVGYFERDGQVDGRS